MDRESITCLIILGFIFWISIHFYKNSDFINLKCIISESDGNKYCIRERKNSKEAVELLAVTVQKMKHLVQYLNKNDPDNEITKRLVDGFNPQRCMETLPTSEHKAYSENKGEKLAFCLNKSNKNNKQLIDKNTLMFVALHELSHIGTDEVGHTEKYWNNFKYILEQAVAAGIYKPVDYIKSPEGYCGMTITDNPYYNE